MINIDLYIFNLINGLAGRWAWLDYFEMFSAKYLEYFLWFFLILLLVINTKKYWKMALEALITAVFTRFFLAEIIRLIWFKPRPFVTLNFIPLIDKSPTEASFPSGHASFYFALSTIVYCYNKKIGTFFYIISFLIVVARVFVGIHWPLDILFGTILGVLTGWVFNKLVYKYAHKIIKNYND